MIKTSWPPGMKEKFIKALRSTELKPSYNYSEWDFQDFTLKGACALGAISYQLYGSVGDSAYLAERTGVPPEDLLKVEDYYMRWDEPEAAQLVSSLRSFAETADFIEANF